MKNGIIILLASLRRKFFCRGESSPRQLKTFVAPPRSLALSWDFKLRRTSQIFTVKVVTRQNFLWKFQRIA